MTTPPRTGTALVVASNPRPGVGQNIRKSIGHANIMGMAFTTFILIALVIVTLVMWILNVFGLMGINLIPFFLGAIGIVAVSTSLGAVTAATTLGGVAAFLNDRDISQGMAGGISMLGRVIWGLLLGWFIIAGFLATWSFSNSPGAFFNVAAASLTAMVLLQFYRITTGKWLVGGVLIYCAGVAFLALASTSPTLVRVGTVIDGATESVVQTLEGKEDGDSVSAPASATTNYVPVDRKVYGYIAPITLEPGQESLAITDFIGSCIYWDVTGGPYPTLLSADKNNVWMVGWKPEQHQIRFRNDSEAVVVISPERRIGSNSCL